MAVTFDREDIEGALRELVDRLVAANASSHIRIVGGAAVAIQFERGSTTFWSCESSVQYLSCRFDWS